MKSYPITQERMYDALVYIRNVLEDSNNSGADCYDAIASEMSELGMHVRDDEELARERGDMWLKAFPSTELGFNTGGRCTAWHLPIPDGRYFLLTDADGDATEPHSTDQNVTIIFYDAEHEIIAAHMSVTWAYAVKYAQGFGGVA